MIALKQNAAMASRVLGFYKELAFNRHSSVKSQIKDLKRRNPVKMYPPIESLLNKNTSVLEVGSGTGWMSNSIAYYCQSQVVGIDFNADAVEFSRQVSKKMKLSSQFIASDLFNYKPERKYDLAISIGVLHHTDDCHAAIERIVNEFVLPGGHIFIGLYHEYGRKPFLDHFATMRAQGASEKDMFERYRSLHSAIKDETHLLSWFRDQVLHPHETQHTFAEMVPLLESCNCSILSTSINHFEPIRSPDAYEEIIHSEKDMERISIERLSNNEYYPGFFLFLAQKRISP